MMHWYRGVFLALLCVGCGASMAASGGEGAGGEPQVAAQTSADPTDGGRRRAAEGDRCDYGGAAELTCQRGTSCCYGPPDDPGTVGHCMPECPEY